MTLGQRLKAYREKEGLTQEQLAEYLNVSRQAVTKWEHDAGMPDIENLVAISRRMGVTLDELVLGQTAEVTAAPELSAAYPFSAGSQPEKGAPSVSSSALPDDPAPIRPKRGTPSERARYHAFAALAFVFATFCQVIAGCVNLAAAFHRSVPAYLPMLNFGSAILLLYTAYAQAAACGRYRRERQETTTNP